MSIHKNTNLMGFNVPNIILYAVIALVLFTVFGIGKMIRNMFNKGSKAVTDALGITTSDKAEETQEQIITRLKKREDIKTQMISGNREKAESLYRAMNGAGTDFTTIKKVIDSITGPAQAGAVYLYFDVRSLNILDKVKFIPTVFGANMIWGFKGNLVQCLENELDTGELKQIKSRLDLFNKL